MGDRHKICRSEHSCIWAERAQEARSWTTIQETQENMLVFPKFTKEEMEGRRKGKRWKKGGKNMEKFQLHRKWYRHFLYFFPPPYIWLYLLAFYIYKWSAVVFSGLNHSVISQDTSGSQRPQNVSSFLASYSNQNQVSDQTYRLYILL